jgi:hypothetical protein
MGTARMSSMIGGAGPPSPPPWLMAREAAGLPALPTDVVLAFGVELATPVVVPLGQAWNIGRCLRLPCSFRFALNAKEKPCCHGCRHGAYDNPSPTKQWLDSLADQRWLCLAGLTIGYKCSVN